MISTVTTKGQVTIPKSIREQCNIRPNDKVDFYVDEERIILMPVKTLRDLRGCVAGQAGDPDQERQAAKKAVGRRTIEEIS